MLEEPRLIWPGSGLQWPEGPHLHHRGDWWYLIIAEGGTERGHVVTVARASTPYGPFEGAPHNPIFTHRSTAHPVENVGHADLVERPDGTWAAVYLGVRTVGWVPRQHVNGRETFIAGIEWQDDWPVFVEDALSIPEPPHAFDEDFRDGLDHPRWTSPGLALGDLVTSDAGPDVVLRPASAPSGTMSGLFVRTRDLLWRARLELEVASGEADVVLRMDERHWFAVRVGGGSARAVVRIGDIEHEVGLAAVTQPASVLISAEPATHRGPDDVVLAVETGGKVTELARLDGRYVSSEVAGGFTGRVLGVVARKGEARILRFAYEPQ
jgi:hypothetical protein